MRLFVLILGAALGSHLVAAAAAVESPATGTQIVRMDPALDRLIAPGTPVERVATGFKFTEGPMWHAGRLWFSDLSDNKMYAVSADGNVKLLIDQSGGLKTVPPGSYLGSNAMAPDKNGSVLMIQQGGRKIVRVSKDLEITPFLDSYQHKKLNSPNDLVFAPDGALWFTDPPFGLARQDQDPGKELKFNAVFRYAKGILTPVITDLTLPNGIGFSPDGKTLYVSNYGPKMYVNAYDVGSGGAVSNRRVFIEYADHSGGPGGPDGLKVDSAGNVWTTGPGGVRIITPQGHVLGLIRFGEAAANVAFGEGGRTAYFTASKSIYRVALTTPGVLPLYEQPPLNQ
jgi:gluconolactonase